MLMEFLGRLKVVKRQASLLKFLKFLLDITQCFRYVVQCGESVCEILHGIVDKIEKLVDNLLSDNLEEKLLEMIDDRLEDFSSDVPPYSIDESSDDGVKLLRIILHLLL